MYPYVKRIFDVLVSFVGLLVFLPFGLIIALCIFLEDFGSVFFIQTRIGRNGKEFGIYKFRTMTPRKDVEKGSFDAGSDKRVTRIGKILRKLKLDEVPQLWNVFKGDMSFVGPRPEVRRWVEEYPERWNTVLTVQPGITDLSSIAFRNEEELLAQSQNPEEEYRLVVLPKKLDYCEKYVKKRSFFLDLGLIVGTVALLLGYSKISRRLLAE